MQKAVDVATAKLRYGMEDHGPPLIGSAKSNFAELVKAIKNEEAKPNVDIVAKLKV